MVNFTKIILLIAICIFAWVSSHIYAQSDCVCNAKPKVVLLNDTSKWYHWGCTGTSKALKEGIERLGFEIQTIPINIIYSLKEVPEFEDFTDPKQFDRFCLKNRKLIQSLKNASAIVVTGEGTIHDLRKGPKALLYLSYISKEFLGKHVEIINHSAYPKDADSPIDEKELNFAREIYKKVYSKLDFVAIREPLSQNEMANIGISATLSFDCLPLYIRDHYQTAKQREDKTLVLAGSVAFLEEGTEKICSYLSLMVERGCKIKVLVGAAASPAKDDEEFVDFLKSHCKVSWELVRATSIDQWLDTINQATLLVSGRFHHSIAAFCLNTPFIALNSNTPKIDGICFFLRQSQPLQFSDPDLLNQLLLRTDLILNSPQVDNRSQIAEIYQLADRNFDGLRTIVSR